jgi:TonB-dependent starch-binding outer membrane protein SusC
MKKRTSRQSLLRIGLYAGCLSLALTGFFPAHAQVANAAVDNIAMNDQQTDAKITVQAKNEKLGVVLEKIEKQSSFVFVYSNDEINTSQKVNLNVKDKSLTEVLQELLPPVNVIYELVNDKIILKPVKSSLPFQNNDNTIGKNVADDVNESKKQEIVVTGRVTDDQGKGLGNVSVSLKGTTIGTVTNDDGIFSLRIPDDRANGTLVFTSVGFTKQEMLLNGKTSIDVKMAADLKDLGEVVVVGYGTQRKTSVTGSLDVVGKKAIEGRPVTNVLTALQGTSPNLIIQQRNFEPGQPVNLNIRGLGTLGNNTPLIVIDGIIGGDINLINPNDIENVSVLKDAGTAAIYGSRSANGVILITTKKGRKNEKPRINYNGIYGIQSPRVTYDPVDAWENAYHKNVSLANSGLAPAFTPQQIRDFADRGNGDWRVDNIIQNAAQQSHNLSVSGGGANNTYMISLGFLDQKNNFVGPNYGYKRYNIRLNQTNEIGKFKLNTILSYVKVQGKDHSYNAPTLVVDASRVPLYFSYQDSAGKYLTNAVSAQFNPKAILEEGGTRTSNDDEIFGNLNAEFAITKDIKIRGVAGGTVRSNNSFERQIQLKFNPGGSYGDDRRVTNVAFKSLFTNLQLMAEYNKRFNEHELKVLVGGANESEKSESFVAVNKLTDPLLGTPVSGTPNESTNTISGTNITSLNSVFGRASYSLSDKYFAEFNFRYDGSSKFAKGKQWGFFPSGALAWRLTEEAFMSNVKDKIGDIKLRTSYGVLGNQNVNPYQYQTSFFNYNNAYGFNNTVVGGAGFSLGNPNLTWEKAATFNLGVDFSVLKRKLELSFDYFNKTTSDILYRRSDVPQLFGAGFPDFNVAKVRNKGWEFRANYNLAGKKFNHTFSVNLADNLNELLELTSGATEQVERREEFEFVRRIGQPITVYQGYKRNGYFQNLDDIKGYPKFANSTVTAGDIKFVDRNKDGIIDDQDKFILGNPFPRYTFGFTYTLAVMGFDLQLFIQGVGKRDAMIRGEQVEPFHFGYGGTMYTHQTDYWTPTNPNAKWPRLAEAGSASNSNNYRVGSDIYLFDAAYARLKNVQIGYSLPQNIVKKAGMQRARLYITGQNLVTLSKLNFIDPEITEFDNNAGFNTGANSARAYFLPVFYGFGLDITF